jgi:hypothetical protein
MVKIFHITVFELYRVKVINLLITFILKISGLIFMHGILGKSQSYYFTFIIITEVVVVLYITCFNNEGTIFMSILHDYWWLCTNDIHVIVRVHESECILCVYVFEHAYVTLCATVGDRWYSILSIYYGIVSTKFRTVLSTSSSLFCINLLDNINVHIYMYVNSTSA